ncbi:MAG: preprotein translocase subunit SecG [Deltaproteobacteria bacterium GWC2_42_11]|nr:MAG: preprotein translocase subunit SecG [Deltaproteobacteria bacterium GWC2_42_11]HBO84706.1 preprotein translocase subunit SecG [Deltaproteobacteria bacterium]
MFALLVTLHVIVSIFLIVSVLLQAGKGASIGAAFGGASSQTLFGSSGPAPFLAKITAACAVIFMVTSITLTYMSANRLKSSIMKDVPAVTQPQPEKEKQQ